MLRINQIKLKPNHTKEDLDHAVYKALRLNASDCCKYEIVKRSIDARHKPDIMFIYSVDIESVTSGGNKLKESFIMHKAHNKNLIEVKRVKYEFPCKINGQMNEDKRPVIIGFGPAGIFAALKLAEAGLCPIVYERGQSVEERQKSVDLYWADGTLNTESNVQFGEGGAGTFSDGKLNTGVKDPSGRIQEVLRVFVRFGADSAILYQNKPHIGTDVLSKVVQNIRNHIIELGGEVHFNTKMEKLCVKDNKVTGVEMIAPDGSKFVRNCENVCLAIGHSARDTFEMLHGINCQMTAKAFAVGVRIEHPQSMINFDSYGNTIYDLPTADYKVTYQTENGRGVYSFCMCPGGYVVNASSEEGRIAVNGMSYSKRDSRNANSAIIVTVTPQDYGNGVLDGVAFQRKLEEYAYREGKGNVPIQLFGDFRQQRISTGLGEVIPCIRGNYNFADLNQIFPDYISSSITEGISGFARHVKGFDREDAILSGVESRTSSPVRILRDDKYESDMLGLFPCGEGAGYAGGITSAAVDGIKVAEQLALKING